MLQNHCTVLFFFPHFFLIFTLHLLLFWFIKQLQTGRPNLRNRVCDANLNVWHDISVNTNLLNISKADIEHLV